MEFGVCYRGPSTDAIAAAGFEYVERQTGIVLNPAMSEQEWNESRATILGAGLPTPVFNLFVPGELKTVGPERDLPALVEYADVVLERAAAVGARIQVFGSGGSRTPPEDYPLERAADEFKETVASLAPVASHHGVVLAMEHLRATESPLLQTLGGTAEFVREVDHPAVRLLADIYHMAQMDEPASVIRECSDLLVHVHLADPETRMSPAPDRTDLRPYFRELKAAGYDGRMSIESRWEDMERDLATAYETVAGQWNEA